MISLFKPGGYVKSYWCVAGGTKNVSEVAEHWYNLLENIADCHKFLVNDSWSKTIRIAEHVWAFLPLSVSPRVVCCERGLARKARARAPELLSTRCGRCVERGLMRPDVEIMFAFSFLECYRLSWNSAWQFLTTRQPSAPAPLLFSRCGTDASLLVLWLCSRPPIAGDRCQDQQGPCLNIAVTVLP